MNYFHFVLTTLSGKIKFSLSLSEAMGKSQVRYAFGIVKLSLIHLKWPKLREE